MTDSFQSSVRGTPSPIQFALILGAEQLTLFTAIYFHSLRAHLADLEGTAQSPESPRQAGATHSDRDSRTGHTTSPAGNTLPMSLAAMGTAVPGTPDAACHDQYYGQSSLVSLVHQYAQSSPGHRSVQSQSKHAVASIMSPSSFASGPSVSSSTNMATLLSDDFSLPPRRLADWLLEVYFNNNHIFYPWLHKESFMVKYEALWTNKDNDTSRSLPDVGLGGHNCPPSVFNCALNAMFAIACEFSNMDPRDKRTSSMMFYERMKSLMNIDILDSGSLAHVQALLIVAIYLQCTQYPKRCWNVIGMAHRMAVGLGLQNRRQFNDMTALEQEIRWRAWCACVQMDIIISMTMGRPPMTSDHSRVPLPSPVDDKYLSLGHQGSRQPEGTISTNQFLHQNMKLIGILWKVLLKIYHIQDETQEETRSPVREDEFKAVMEIDKALEEFEISLPVVFAWKPPNTPSSNRTLRRQSNVLHARYLHLKLLLYRPTFSAYCSAAMPTSVQTQPDSWSMIYQQSAALRCVQAACDLIHSLSKATTEDATGAWWYGVFYLISAGIVLVLTDSSGADFSGITPVQLEDSWNECLETLNRMIGVHPSARDYCIALNELRQSHSAELSRNRGPDQFRTNQAPSDAVGNDGISQDPGSLLQTDHTEFGVPGPFFENWDTEIGDIMLPAQFLQNLDEELLLPNLF
ncbi:hypothetical protein PENSOL_c019G00914 [Penicillium solitum]|uniref:Xylanolytic transcriptional activator regulatory domain-containing protein n=1 Tax=Penicillium solitum TaxID=60172 RepID=A0A1V6R2N4_9EURO|nr:uncharacterized protein PENSOL_c019G00914 [Penicillium solitum]OQD95699.1 hypothetical protein PENSOL_c019G00914 [Penicillium solitum]